MMNTLQVRFILMHRSPWVLFCENMSQRRYRYKPKWAMQIKASSNCEKALDHFDAFYKPVYGDLWPSIRLSLLSLPKHCALVNKYSDVYKVEDRLEIIGSFNILKYIRSNNSILQSDNVKSFNNILNTNTKGIDKDDLDLEGRHLLTSSGSSDDDIIEKSKGPEELLLVLDGDNIEPYDEDLHKDNLNVFVPPEPMVTDKEQLLEEEIQASSFQPRDITINTVTMEPILLPMELDAFIFPPGDVSRFPQPKAFNQTSGYYLMDAASFLPVLAMNLDPSDQVLDLCAAPGGKSIAMLQTLDFGTGGLLHCNDSSNSRISRLKNVLKSYIPPSIVKDVMVTQRDGLTFDKPVFNKVLVDVPCNTDRHVVTEEENNLFKTSRSSERLQLMRRQRDLLVSGIKSCVVGGSIVYSTCTLAAAQNDGVIQAAVEILRENSKIDVAVQDLSPLTQEFKRFFTFYDKCRYGQLILPCLSQNFGPLYFAKLQRIK